MESDAESQAFVSILGQMPIALEGLRHILNDQGFRVVQIAPDLCGLRPLPGGDGRPAPPHLVVIDGLVEADGAEIVEEVRRAFPAALPVVLVDQFNFNTMKACFQARAHGFIVKKISSASLVTSLRLVAMGEKVMPSSFAEELHSLPVTGADPVGVHQTLKDAGLSVREVEILTCLVSGKPNKVISRQLGISEATVKVHVKAILRKIGVQNRTQAAIWAMEGKVAEAGGEGPAAIRYPLNQPLQVVN